MFKKSLAVCAVCAIGLSANAQLHFNEILVFGDSLLDSGNTGVRFTNRVGNGSGDYSTGNFAQIAPQLFANDLGIPLDSAVAGGTNYAVRGYQTTDIFNSITGIGLAVPSGGAIARPAYLADNPSIGSNTLVLIDGGGNDIRNILMSNPPAAVPGLIQTAAQTYITAIGALDNAGAKYIMVANVPDLGSVPGIRALDLNAPGAIAGFASATAGFNTAVQAFSNSGLSGANIIPVDLNGLVALVFDNAEDYGLATGMIDLGGGLLFDSRFMCFNDNVDSDPTQPDCVEHPLFGIDGATPDPSRLFFNDALHPTALGSAITTDYLTDIILAPRKVGALPEMALSASRVQAEATGNELRQSRWGVSQQGRVFISGDVSDNQYDTSLVQQTDTRQLTVGITHVASEQMLIGIALSLGNQEADIAGADFDADSVGVTGILGYRQQALFVEGSLGLTVLSYDDLEREVKLGAQTFNATGSTDGHSWVLDTLVGYDLLSSPDFHLAPALGLQWMDATVDSYQEVGGQVSNYKWGEQNRKSVQWRYGFVGGVRVTQTVMLHAEVFGSQEREDDTETIVVSNTNLGFTEYQLPSYQADGGSFVVANIGALVNIGNSRLSFTWNYSDQGDGLESALLSFSLPM